MLTELRKCTKCKRKKALCEFSIRKRKGGGRRSVCKDCRKEDARNWQKEHPERVRELNLVAVRKHRKGKFNTSTWKRVGIEFTKGEYDVRLKQQNGVCAICKRPNPSQKKRFCLDHNHNTGQVRGIICDRCNLVVGIVEKEPAIVKAVANYLEIWEGVKCQLNSA